MLDLAIALPGLLLSLPVILILALAVRASSPGPALHWSERIGRMGRRFAMPKLRSMYRGTPVVPTDRLLDAASAVTPLGRFLRRSSLDELPQLWCVVRGDMSLVGPRPALPEQASLVSARRAAGIDQLLPGITGWAQVNGRDELSDEQKLRFDIEYAQRRSVGFDLLILGRTLAAVLAQRGVRH